MIFQGWICVACYGTLWPWPLTLWSWTIVVHPLSGAQTLYQITAKLNNLRLSYSDINTKDLWSSAILDFKVAGFQPLWGLRGPLINQLTKFDQNPTIHGWVILGVNLCRPVLLAGQTDQRQICGRQRTITDPLKACFRCPLYCFVLKLECFKGDWCWKLKLNFALVGDRPILSAK